MRQDCFQGFCLIVSEGASAVLCVCWAWLLPVVIPTAPPAATWARLPHFRSSPGPAAGWAHLPVWVEQRLLHANAGRCLCLTGKSPGCFPAAFHGHLCAVGQTLVTPFSLGPCGSAGQTQLPYTSLSETLFLSGLSQGQREASHLLQVVAGGIAERQRTGAPVLDPGPAAWRPGGLSMACGRTGWLGPHMHRLTLASSCRPPGLAGPLPVRNSAQTRPFITLQELIFVLQNRCCCL